jgi:hypothetical protein
MEWRRRLQEKHEATGQQVRKTGEHEKGGVQFTGEIPGQRKPKAQTRTNKKRGTILSSPDSENK